MRLNMAFTIMKTSSQENDTRNDVGRREQKTVEKLLKDQTLWKRLIRQAWKRRKKVTDNT